MISLVEILDHTIQQMKQHAQSHLYMAESGETGSKKPSPEDQVLESQVEPVFEQEHHSFTEICICVRGCFALQMGGMIARFYAGDAGIILPDVMHNELLVRECDYIALWLTVDFNRVRMHLSGKNTDSPFYTLRGVSLKPGNMYIQRVNDIKMEVENKKGYYQVMAKTYLMHLLIAAHRELTMLECFEQGDYGWREMVITEVRDFIRSNYSKHIRLLDVAQKVCISPNYLNTLYKAATGKTIMQFHEECRLEVSRQLLKNTNESIQKISLQLGYYDQYHFSKIFKKATGYTPTQFRKDSNI